MVSNVKLATLNSKEETEGVLLTFSLVNTNLREKNLKNLQEHAEAATDSSLSIA